MQVYRKIERILERAAENKKAPLITMGLRVLKG